MMEKIVWVNRGVAFTELCAGRGVILEARNGEVFCSDVARFNELVATEYFPMIKADKLAKLHELAGSRIDLFKMIDAGTVLVTNAQFTTFMVAVTNRYRSLKAQIISAADEPALDAIDIATGWPNNP